MELIVVLVVAAILAAVAVPALSSLDQTRAAGAANAVLRDLTFIRQRAVATGTRAWAVFDLSNPAGGSYQLFTEDPSNPGYGNIIPLIDPATGRTMTTVLSDQFTNASLASVDFDGAPVVGFDWLGRPLNQAETDLAADGEVTISGGHRVTVEIVTGDVRHITP